MEITVSHEQARVPVLVFHIRGDIDATSYEQLETQAQTEIQRGARFLALDLTDVAYVSSYGVRAISHIFTWLRDLAGGDDDASLSKGLRDGSYKSRHLKIAHPSPQVLKMLTTVGLDMFLEIHSDLKHALKSF